MMWLFIQNQILGMQWLNGLVADGLIWAGVDIESRLGGSLQFFLYDVIKITLLLCVLILLFRITRAFTLPSGAGKLWASFMESGRISWELCWERLLPFVHAHPFRCLWDLPVPAFRWELPFRSSFRRLW